jgi:SAM-dependent methyltransferase
MYDYLLGGMNNFAADRAAVERMLTHVPHQRVAAFENRRFLDRAVRFLAAPGRGITQFLDIGAGLPRKESVLEMARWVNPEARVAYVDYDPVVVSHGKAILAERGSSVMVQADLRDPESLLASPEIQGHLDFSRPVGLILVNILHWIADADRPREIMGALRDALAPGSHLIVTHASPDLIGAADAEAARRAARAFENANAQLRMRSRLEVLGLLDGWKLTDPGLVPRYQWHPIPSTPAFTSDAVYAGVASRA